MKNPVTGLIQDAVFVPVNKIYRKLFTKKSLLENCNKCANFIFKYSKETALIMLIFSSISIISSHVAQILGLKKSKRENKDYLIKQENNELKLDLIFTIIPPFVMNHFIKKKLIGGQWVTKESQEKLINLVGPVVGASRDDFYCTDNIRPIRETIGVLISKILDVSAKKIDKIKPDIDSKTQVPLKETIEKASSKIKEKLPDPALVFYGPDTEIIATDFDDMVRQNRVSDKLIENLRNGSAYDDLLGEINGILIMATLGYTILASSIITPYLKNKMANRSYEKQLRKMGETKESIKRKKRFDSALNALEYDDLHLFDVFSNVKESSSGRQVNLFNYEKQKKPDRSAELFKTFSTYSRFASQSSGLRI